MRIFTDWACRIMVFVLASSLAGTALAETRSYPIPSHGTLVLNVPAGWKDHVSPPPTGLPPTITFKPLQGEAFEVLVSPLWSPDQGERPHSDAALRQIALGARDKAKPQVIEHNIP